MGDFDNNDHGGEIFAKSVRAGKRTYFFDVRATRSNEYYLTITESKKKFTEGVEKPFFEKHKIFLYKEDFEKFTEGLQEAIAHIQSAQPEKIERRQENPSTDNNYTDLNFDDLGK
jgi:hypothetical protein